MHASQSIPAQDQTAQTADSHKKTIRGVYARDIQSLSHSMMGMASLFDEMAAQGVTRAILLADTGIKPAALNVSDPATRISHQQKLALFSKVLQHSREPGVGLRIGQRQRLADLGVYGYALSSSATLGAAVDFGIRHIKLAGPVLEKTFHLENEVAVFEGRDVIDLGELLPLVSEYWLSSIVTLLARIMERPFQTIRLLLPYPAPKHAALYEEVFQCPVEFDTGVMQWYFDAALLTLPCPNANPITADICAKFCARMLPSLDANEPEIVRSIRLACLNSTGGLPGIEKMAAQLNLSSRTLHRHLADAGTGYQKIVDDVRRRLAEEFLINTGLNIEEIAERTGFSDASNFRKAFRKWTGEAPAEFRSRTWRG